MNKIKYIILLSVFVSGIKTAQTKEKIQKEGKISFVTSQNIYVRFDNTEGIKREDTLFAASGGRLQPAMVVKYISTTSCSGEAVKNQSFTAGQSLIAFVESSFKPPEVVVNKEFKGVQADLNQTANPGNKIPVKSSGRIIEQKRTQGRFSVSSYSNFSNTPGITDIQRWRYSLSVKSDSIMNSPVSFSGYVNMAYRTDHWSGVTNNLGSALRFYEFALQYDLSKSSRFFIGRKINPKTSSLGAVDGLQMEIDLNKFVIGAVAGSRPSFTDYGLDAKLFQYGGYVYRSDSIFSVAMQNTIGIFQQTNNFKTDRRFLYWQHSNSLTQNLGFFISSEFDLYKRQKGIDKNIFDMTSMFVMGTYTPASWLSLNATYDARKNVVYYETFKNIADSILESSLRQGLGFRANVRPFNFVWISALYNYRFAASDPKPSRNYGGSFSYTQIPLINSSFYFNYNKIETAYLTGNYFSANMNKDIFNGDINIGIGYRKVDYNFYSGLNTLKQNIAAFEITWRISSMFFFTLNYEGTFQDKSSFSNLFCTFNVRF